MIKNILVYVGLFVVNPAAFYRESLADFDCQVMSFFEAAGIGHECVTKALNPCCLMYMAAQAEGDRIYFQKRFHTVTATPKTENE